MHALLKMAASARPRAFCQLGMVRTKANEVHPGYARLRRNQQRFQVDDGCPVHLKKGLPDRLLYWATVSLSIVGVTWALKDILSLVFPSEVGQAEEEEEE